uniref:Neur_chan_LBD domain-containing protein n=1 Tax=Heterorhabditis bacteriophora TaxID=37862 RepID=A0A1I7WVI2_HETBA
MFLVPVMIMLSCTTLIVSRKVIWAGDHERRLYTKLADGYNKLARPVRNETEPVLVLLGLDYQQILDIVSVFIFQNFYIHSSFLLYL